MSGSTVDLTVVMAVRDGARYLAEALDSVLAQEPAPREVVAHRYFVACRRQV